MNSSNDTASSLRRKFTWLFSAAMLHAFQEHRQARKSSLAGVKRSRAADILGSFSSFEDWEEHVDRLLSVAEACKTLRLQANAEAVQSMETLFEYADVFSDVAKQSHDAAALTRSAQLPRCLRVEEETEVTADASRIGAPSQGFDNNAPVEEHDDTMPEHSGDVRRDIAAALQSVERGNAVPTVVTASIRGVVPPHVVCVL